VGAPVLPRQEGSDGQGWIRYLRRVQQRLLVVAIVICGVILVLLGAHRIWQRVGAPSSQLESALAIPSVVSAAMPSGLLDVSPVSERDGFLVATMTESRGAPSTPRTPGTLTDPWSATFADDLCAGRESAWDALEAMVASAPPGAIDAALGTRIAELVSHGCMVAESEQACRFARAALDASDVSAPIAWQLLAHCPDEVALPLLDRVDAPASAILRFVLDREALGRRSVRLPAYMLQSVTSALASTRPEAPFAFHQLAAALGHYDDPSATRALVAMYEVAPGYAREVIGISIRFPDDDRSRAIHQESCATVPVGSVLHACNDGSLASRVSAFELDVHLELARHPETRDEMLAALETCAAGNDPLSGIFCFRRLAELDRERAAGIAQSRIARGNVPLLGLPAVGDPPPYVSELEHEVRRFPSEGSVTAALASCGIGSAPVRPWEHPVTVLDALASRDRALTLDPESGTFPTPHDALLRRLAHLVSPALDEVVFEQVAPDETQMAVGRYTLRAFTGQSVLETYARNYGDFYDVEAAVGFVNALLLRRGALDRCRVVGHTEATAIVCASLPQLAALESAQLVTAPAEAME